MVLPDPNSGPVLIGDGIAVGLNRVVKRASDSDVSVLQVYMVSFVFAILLAWGGGLQHLMLEELASIPVWLGVSLVVTATVGLPLLLLVDVLARFPSLVPRLQ